MIILLLKFILLITIFLGLFLFCEHYLKVKDDFIPLVCVSAISIVMFISGLLNIMYGAVLLIILVSFYSLTLIPRGKTKITNLISPGIWFFIISSLFLAFSLNGYKFYAYDDFSHWGLVARETLLFNRFPTFNDQLISFQSYPTGTAGFIYFIGKIVNSSEGIMLFAQSLLILSGIAPLFSFVKKKKILSYFIISLFSIYLLLGNNGVTTLYVDAVLTSVVLAVTSIIFYYFLEGDTLSAILPLLLGNMLLIGTKNSGLLFATITTFLFLFFRAKEEPSANSLKYNIIAIFPFFMKVLWDKHVELVFTSGDLSKHSLSISNFKTILGDKSLSDIFSITKLLFIRSLDISKIDVTIVFYVFAFLMFVLLYKRYNQQKNNLYQGKLPEKTMLYIVVGLYVIYQVGLLLTYIFSMPLSEALYLASYGRYNITLSTYFLGMFIIYFFENVLSFSTINNPFKWFFTFSFMFVLFYLVISVKEPVYTLLSNDEYKNSPREKLEKIIDHNYLDIEDKVYIYVSDYTKEYARHFLSYQFRYTLRSTDFQIVEYNTLGKLNSMKDTDSILIILKEDREILNYISEIGIDNSNIVK